MHPADIHAALRKKGVTQKDIADELGVHPVTVSRVILKMGVSARVMIFIAKKIGSHPREVWPEYFNAPPKRKNSTVVNW